MSKVSPDPVHILHNVTGPVTALATIQLQDCKESGIISGSQNGSVSIWNLEIFRAIKTWQAHQTSVLWLAEIDNKPGFFLSHGRQDSITIWNSENQSTIYKIPVSHDGFCKCDLFERTLLIPNAKSDVEVFSFEENLQDFKKRKSLAMKANEGAIMSMKILNESQIIATAYESGVICNWFDDEDEPRSQVRVDSMPVCLSFNKDRKELLVGTAEILYILDAIELTKVKEVELTNPGLNAIALRPSDGRIYVTAGWDKRLRYFSSKTHKMLCVLQVHDDTLNALVFTTGHRSLLAAGGSDALISLWDLYRNEGSSCCS